MNELIPQALIRQAAGMLPNVDEAGVWYPPETNRYDDKLSAVQRALISKYVNIQMFFCNHDNNPDSFALAETVVEPMDPAHDILILEGTGYRQTILDSELAQVNALDASGRLALARSLQEACSDPTIDVVDFNSYTYAGGIAYLKGVRLETGDFDYFDEAAWHELRGLDPRQIASLQLTGFEHPLLEDEEYQVQRTRVALNKVKHLAVEAAIKRQQSSVPGKTFLRGMYGPQHHNDIVEFGRRLRLPLKTFVPFSM